MNTEQKGFINIAVIIGIVVATGVAGYFVLSQQTTTSPVPTPISTMPISIETPGVETPISTPPTNDVSLPPQPAPSARSVSAIFESRKQLVKTTISIEDVVTFEYRCTDNEGPQTCSTNVFIGPMNSEQFHIKENGAYVTCDGTVAVCKGWEKNKRYRVTGVLGVPKGSENFSASYYVDVARKEIVGQ
jgi:hypothetical protein